MKHVDITPIWIANRFLKRKKMTGKGLFLDKNTGFLVTKNKHGFDGERKKAFLARFTVCSNLAQIAKSLGLDIQTIYDHLAMDERFREEFNKLNEIEGKATQLNSALVEASKVEQIQFINEINRIADKYRK